MRMYIFWGDTLYLLYLDTRSGQRPSQQTQPVPVAGSLWGRASPPRQELRCWVNEAPRWLLWQHGRGCGTRGAARGRRRAGRGLSPGVLRSGLGATARFRP